MVFSFDKVQVVLLDIEGTVCSISFVKDVLFPYALKALPDVLKSKWDDADFVQYRDQFPEDARATPEALEEHVKDLTARDVKIAYLKNLQGYLWQSGYENGSYTTDLFADVLPQLQKWHDFGVQLAIFSSGSVFAQKLLFRHATAPEGPTDQTGIINGWFDTVNAGPKVEASSYRKIADALGVDTDAVLFLSDNVKEITAALEANMPAVLVDRPGNAPLSGKVTETFKLATSLDEISVTPGGSGVGATTIEEPAAKKVKLAE